MVSRLKEPGHLLTVQQAPDALRCTQLITNTSPQEILPLFAVLHHESSPDKMYLHSHQPRSIVLASTTHRSVTYPCLISDPLPADFTDLKVQIVGHDQGYCSDPTAGPWTWFEASLLRSQTDSLHEPILADNIDPVRETPETFAQTFQGNGWAFIHLDKNGEGPADAEHALPVSIPLCTNAVSVEWQTHNCHSSSGDNPRDDHEGFDVTDFTALLRKGDRFVIWARARVCSVQCITMMRLVEM